MRCPESSPEISSHGMLVGERKPNIKWNPYIWSSTAVIGKAVLAEFCAKRRPMQSQVLSRPGQVPPVPLHDLTEHLLFDRVHDGVIGKLGGGIEPGGDPAGERIIPRQGHAQRRQVGGK